MNAGQIIEIALNSGSRMFFGHVAAYQMCEIRLERGFYTISCPLATLRRKGILTSPS